MTFRAVFEKRMPSRARKRGDEDKGRRANVSVALPNSSFDSQQHAQSVAIGIDEDEMR